MAAVESVLLLFAGGDEAGWLLEGGEVGEVVALEAIDRALEAVVVEVAILELVETWAEEARVEGEVEEEVAL